MSQNITVVVIWEQRYDGIFFSIFYVSVYIMLNINYCYNGGSLHVPNFSRIESRYFPLYRN